MKIDQLYSNFTFHSPTTSLAAIIIKTAKIIFNEKNSDFTAKLQVNIRKHKEKTALI
ncbi:MAG: hypothetical protein FWH37_06075 [Candidatus Bathyarchaeota archaeon]|nr:hypothetical protein [Candidatus Termiticorpusculum sp.]